MTFEKTGLNQNENHLETVIEGVLIVHVPEKMQSILDFEDIKQNLLKSIH